MKPTAPEEPASLPRASFVRSNEALIWHMEYLSGVLTELRQRAMRGELPSWLCERISEADEHLLGAQFAAVDLQRAAHNLSLA